MNRSTIDATLLILLGGAWGSAFVGIRAGIQSGASPFAFAAVRYLLATGAFIVLALAAREPLPSRRSLGISALLGGPLMIGGYALFLYWGEGQISAGYAAVLIAGSPIASAILARSVLPGERFSGLGAAGIAIGFVGVVVMFLPELGSGHLGQLEGALSVLAAAVAFAIGSVVMRRVHPSPQGQWGIGVQFAASTAFLAPFALLTPGGTALPLTATVVGALVYLVVVSSIVGYLIYFVLHDRVGPARANLVAYVNPVVGVGLGVLLLGESVSVPEIAGFALIVVGIAALQVERHRRSRTPTAASVTVITPEVGATPPGRVVGPRIPEGKATGPDPPR
ncbi:MAG: EamA family transporter [Thermoplasmata archaeon]|nr:EamA family transporter [Thermoplasmata archaeon]